MLMGMPPFFHREWLDLVSVWYHTSNHRPSGMLYPKAPRTHISRFLGPKTISYRAFWAILRFRVWYAVGFNDEVDVSRPRFALKPC